MFWIALAAQLTAPVPTNPSDWFNADDVPQYLVSKGNGLWLVGVRVTVSPDSSVQGCEIESSSGLPELDRFTCSTLARRAKFRAAQWDEGTAVFGVFRTFVSWAVSDSNVPPDLPNVGLPNVDLSVVALPQGISSPALTRVMFKVDAEGRVSSCTAEQIKTLKHVQNDPVLISTACQQITQKFMPIPAKDVTGKPLPSVQDAMVRFSKPKR